MLCRPSFHFTWLKGERNNRPFCWYPYLPRVLGYLQIHPRPPKSRTILWPQNLASFLDRCACLRGQQTTIRVANAASDASDAGGRWTAFPDCISPEKVYRFGRFSPRECSASPASPAPPQAGQDLGGVVFLTTEVSERQPRAFVLDHLTAPAVQKAA